MKNFKCINGHEFNMAETQGEEWTETDVCPICKTDNFERIKDDGSTTGSSTEKPSKSE